MVAHNALIQKTPVDFDGFISCYPMGQRLSMTFGEKYKAFAITNLRGETAALYPDNDYQFGFRVDKFPLDFPESDSVEFIMQEFGGKECCLLMNRSTELKNCNKIRFDSMCLKTEIEEAFDGIFLIEKSTVSEVVDWEFINLISKRHFLFGGAVLFFHITCRVLAMGGIFSTEL